MRVTLKTAAEADGARVSIAAVGVSGSALWRGTAQEAGTEVDVELEIGEDLDWSKVSVGPSVGAIAEGGSQGLFVRGFVEDLQDDGVLILRVAEGIVMIDTLGEPPSGILGQEVSLAFRDVEIFSDECISQPRSTCAVRECPADPRDDEFTDALATLEGSSTMSTSKDLSRILKATDGHYMAMTLRVDEDD